MLTESSFVKNDDEAIVTGVAEEILCYLKTHPKAADTLDGVVHWWLLRQRYMRGLKQVQQALDELVEQGLVEKRSYADGTAIYAATVAISEERIE